MTATRGEAPKGVRPIRSTRWCPSHYGAKWTALEFQRVITRLSMDYAKRDRTRTGDDVLARSHSSGRLCDLPACFGTGLSRMANRLF